MNKGALPSFLLLGACAVFLTLSPLFAIEIAPASAGDILNALGPDGRGLALSQETLPDLFALTASRIEENPKQFTVVQPYLSGRWKGGKVVIEYARDLSYTLVSVYDKEGHRQRIYSVRTIFNEHVAQLAQQTTPTAPPAQTAEPNPAPPSENSAWEQAAPAPAPPAAPRHKRGERSAPAPSASANPTEPAALSEQASTGFEWDEASGSYVPVGGAAPAAEEPSAIQTVASKPAGATQSSSSRKRQRQRQRTEELAVASARTTPSSSADKGKTAAPPPMQDSGIWLAAPTPSKTTSRTESVVKAGDATWVERASQTPAEEKPKRHRKKKHAEEAPTAAPLVTAEKTTSNDEWVPKSIEPGPGKAKAPEAAKRAVEGEVPSTEDLLTGPSAATPSESSSPTPSKKRSRKHRKAPVAEEASPAAAPLHPTPVAVASAPQEPSAPAQTPAPPPQKAAMVTPPPAANPPTPAPAPAPPPAPPPKQPQPPVPTAEELLAKAGTPMGPDTSEGDKWVPKAVPKPAVAEPDATGDKAEAMKVAMVPKSAPADNSVDNLLKMAEEGKGSMPRESDTWVPKKTAAAKPDVDINREIQRVREEEKKRAAPKPRVQVRHDVNNPEEGVLPVSSFEKFSGPMYGRHREYERRFYPGKKTKSKAPEHDFYVDEVDRKKEIHNVYYYQHQKGKAPRLVAVERHDRVSFMGNYDIEKEDKGKLSSYN